MYYSRSYRQSTNVFFSLRDLARCREKKNNDKIIAAATAYNNNKILKKKTSTSFRPDTVRGKSVSRVKT